MFPGPPSICVEEFAILCFIVLAIFETSCILENRHSCGKARATTTKPPTKVATPPKEASAIITNNIRKQGQPRRPTKPLGFETDMAVLGTYVFTDGYNLRLDGVVGDHDDLSTGESSDGEKRMRRKAAVLCLMKRNETFDGGTTTPLGRTTTGG